MDNRLVDNEQSLELLGVYSHYWQIEDLNELFHGLINKIKRKGTPRMTPTSCLCIPEVACIDNFRYPVVCHRRT